VRFKSGHNGRGKAKTPEHIEKMSAGMRRAWATKRHRYPLGSKRKDTHGYVVVKVLVGEGRWDKEHVLIVERQIGRRLVAGEQVHHINGIRDDNRPENLHLCPNGSIHARAHGSFERLIGGLIADGIVRFNRQTAEYERC
jgi:hypothetical protein